MKKKENGFIATSLIYSFFLVFLAVLLATLNGYITNDRILSTYNKSIKEKLNNKAYIPMIFAIGNDCYVEEGVSTNTLNACFYTYNMVANPTEGDDYKCYIVTPGVVMDENLQQLVYDTKWLSKIESPHKVTCMVRNKAIDERYMYSASTNIHVVSQIQVEVQ